MEVKAEALKENSSSTSRSQRTRATVGLLIFLCLPVRLVLYLRESLSVQLLPLGETIPPIELRKIDSAQPTIMWRPGKKTVFLFFTIACPHCKKALSNLAAFHPVYHKQMDFVVVSLSDLDKTKAFLAGKDFPFPFYHCDDLTAKKTFKVPGVPALYLVDEEGKLRYRRLGDGTLEKDGQILAAFVSNTLGTEPVGRALARPE